MPIHIGKEIEKIAESQGVGQTELGKRIFTTQQNVGNIYTRATLDVDLLLLISKALKFNFIELYYNEEPLKDFRQQELNSWNNKISALNTTITYQEETIKLQEELLVTQRKLIEELEKKSM